MYSWFDGCCETCSAWVSAWKAEALKKTVKIVGMPPEVRQRLRDADFTGGRRDGSDDALRSEEEVEIGHGVVFPAIDGLVVLS